MSEGSGPVSRRKYEAAETRENILQVATREFADKGLAGARIDEIAASTDSSKRMIYYYFGGKDGLYRAVLERAYAHIRDQERDVAIEALPAREALRALVANNFDYHAEHPEFVRLVMSENIARGEHIAQIAGMKSRNRSVIDQLEGILARGVAEGLFREGLAAVDVHTTISALSFYNVSNRHTFNHNFGVDFADPEVRERRRAQIADAVLAWVAKG